jgi:ribosomal protein L32
MIKPGRQLAWQKKRKEMGKCPHCGKENMPGRRACIKLIEYRMRRYLDKKGVGIYVTT